MSSVGLSERRLGFLHIQKTGGTSIGALVNKAHPDARLDTTSTDFLFFTGLLGETPVVGGHIPFWLWQAEPTPRRLFTLLRDPIQRVVSIYKFVHLHNGHYAYRYMASQQTTLAECYRHPLLRAECTNFQTKMLGFAPRQPLVLPCTGRDDYAAYCGMHSDYYFGDGDEAMLQRAIAHLRDEVDFAILEDPASITALVERVLGMADRDLPRLNTTESINYEADAAEIDLIRQNNRLDLALYEAARSILAERGIAGTPASAAITPRTRCRSPAQAAGKGSPRRRCAASTACNPAETEFRVRRNDDLTKLLEQIAAVTEILAKAKASPSF